VTSPLDVVMQMGDTALSLEDAGAFQLDLPRCKALEQTAPGAEENRNDMELELIKNACSECEPRTASPFLACTSTGPCGAAEL